MTMEWKVSFTYANPLFHSKEEVLEEIIRLLLSDSLNDIEDLKIELID